MDIDSDVELIVPDNLEETDDCSIFPDFSQVQIEVHSSDVAEKIIEDIVDPLQHEVFGTEEYLDPTVDDDIQEISDDSPEQIQEESMKIVENIFVEQESVQEYYQSTDITEDDNTQEDFDNIERIPDKDISKYDAVIEEYPDYENVLIKEEIEPFMGTDYKDFEASPTETHNKDDLPPEDIYHWKNVIILGTKPCQSTSKGILTRLNERDSIEENENRKENLNAFVLLEDWNDKLERSQCFCKDCGTLFVTPNELDAHKMMAHSFLVPINKNVATKSTTKPAFARKSTGTTVVKSSKNIARKSTGSKATGSFCNHCNKVFADNTTLIKHLYELLPLKQSTCNICDAVFKTQKDLTDHNLMHVKTEVTVKKEKIDKNSEDIGNREDVRKKRLSSLKQDVEMIPNSILFQCPKCSVHFVTAYAGFLHSLYCIPSKAKKKPAFCDICKRKLHPRDLNIHKKQHKISTKFRVFKVSKNLSEKTLCKCPNCELHFSDFGMNLHLKLCGKIPSEHCDRCNILVPKTKFALHMKMHTQQNLKPKDFLNIQYTINGCAIKRKLESPMAYRKKIKLEHSPKINTSKNSQKVVKTKMERCLTEKVKRGRYVKRDKHQIYFCKICKGCCSLNNHGTLHLKKQCLLMSNVAARTICPDCGLQFSKSNIWYHRSLHRKGMTLNNISVYDLQTLQKTIPTIPDYPQCQDCKIKFFDVKVQAEHICGEDYETCVVCGEKYHCTAYDVHVEFHKWVENEKIVPNMATKAIPELLKKYKSLNMMWNIVYNCNVCNKVTDEYDKAVEHSQGHLNCELVSRHIKCYICNLKFDETCWSKHSDLHAQMNINSKDFKILGYNPRKLLTEEWFELFHDLPNDLIRQVIDKSVYDSERRFKLKVLKEGRSEFTVYCCSDCQVGCRNNEIEKHIKAPCRNSTNICKICSIPFSDISTLRNHQIVHLNGVKKEDFRVVLFNKQQMHNTNKIMKLKKLQIKRKQPAKAKHKLTKQKPKLLTKRKTIKADTSKIKSYKGIRMDKNGKYILYRCRNCKCCIHFQRNLSSHNCSSQSYTEKCQQCNELIGRRYFSQHERRHLDQPNFHLHNFVIKMFDPQNNSKSKDEVKPIKKKYKTVNRQGVKGGRTKLNKDKPWQKQKEGSNESTPTKADTLNKMAIVYKCNCGLHYTSLENIEKHVETCESDTDISKEYCSKCGLLFPTNILVSHLCKHHSRNSTFTVELYQKSYVNPNMESTSESPGIRKSWIKNKVKLYKCKKCNIHFVNQNTCYKHCLKHQPINHKYSIICKLCGLKFSKISMSLHANRHHANEMSLDDILVEEYQPATGKGPPKVNLYEAAVNVQSLQVTSSIEDK